VDFKSGGPINATAAATANHLTVVTIPLS
jgi:hypothetical protein